MNHFIKLPDGTIINTARVERVFRTEIASGKFMTTIELTARDFPIMIADNDGEMFGYFDGIAQPVGGE